jgi:2-C-methyl-D-erythritol 4-phosphate cytidylyltransferase
MAQTPQGFRYSILKKAFDDALADGFLGTDEASLIERADLPVVVVMGSPRNHKNHHPRRHATGGVLPETRSEFCNLVIL